MVSLTLVLIIGACMLCIMAWFKWQSHCSEIKVAETEKKNTELQKQNQQLQVQKTATEAQVKNHTVRKKNEESISGSSRSNIIDSLHAHGDLRSDE